MSIGDWSSDVCSSDLCPPVRSKQKTLLPLKYLPAAPRSQCCCFAPRGPPSLPSCYLLGADSRLLCSPERRAPHPGRRCRRASLPPDLPPPRPCPPRGVFPPPHPDRAAVPRAH